MRRNLGQGVLLGVAVLVVSGTVFAQGIRTPSIATSPDLKWSTGGGPSAGVVLDTDRWFWGVGWDVGYALNEHWSVAGALAYDQETEPRRDLPNKLVNTFTGTATVSYSVTEHFSLTTGLGVGFLDDDNPKQEYRMTGGDLGTGLAVGYVWPWMADRAFSLSCAYEWSLSDDEASLSFDGGISLSF